MGLLANVVDVQGSMGLLFEIIASSRRRFGFALGAFFCLTDSYLNSAPRDAQGTPALNQLTHLDTSLRSRFVNYRILVRKKCSWNSCVRWTWFWAASGDLHLKSLSADGTAEALCILLSNSYSPPTLWLPLRQLPPRPHELLDLPSLFPLERKTINIHLILVQAPG